MLKSGGVGVKVKGNNAAPDSVTIFRIGSVSKVFAVSLKIDPCKVNSGILTNSIIILCVGFNFVSDACSWPGYQPG